MKCGLGPVGLTVSLPAPLPVRPLRILVVLGGANTGRKNLRQVPTAGANILVGYDWPLPRKLPKGQDLARALPSPYPQLLEVPGQVAAAIGWIAGQETLLEEVVGLTRRWLIDRGPAAATE